jgi:hypothetical protein
MYERPSARLEPVIYVLAPERKRFQMSTDTAVGRALARKEAIAREIESLQTELRDIDTFVALYPRFADEQDTNLERPNVPEETPEVHPTPRHDDTPTAGNGMITQEQFETDIRKVLIDNRRPMKRGQLVNALHSRGLKVGGTDEYKNFGSKIWKARDRFINIPQEGYWPRDIPCAAVEYRPEPGTSSPTDWQTTYHVPPGTGA